MTLKNDYEDVKRGQMPQVTKVSALIIALGIITGYVFLIYLGWHNLVSKIFDIPDMTYTQTLGMTVWVYLVKVGLFTGTKNEKNR